MSSENAWFLWSKSKLQQMLRISVVCLNNICWSIERFVTKFLMVVLHFGAESQQTCWIWFGSILVMASYGYSASVQPELGLIWLPTSASSFATKLDVLVGVLLLVTRPSANKVGLYSILIPSDLQYLGTHWGDILLHMVINLVFVLDRWEVMHFSENVWFCEECYKLLHFLEE